MIGYCAVCNDGIEQHVWEDHLRIVHPAPMGGFRFTLDARPFFTNKPSMLVADVKRLANCPPVYTFFQEIPGPEDAVLSDAQSVDLTHEPRFYVVPPATY